MEIHAEWLEKNGFSKEAKECSKQAKETKDKDWRQVYLNRALNKVKKK